MKKIILILLIPCLLTITFGCTTTPTTTMESQPQETISSKIELPNTYKNEDFDFSLKYPANWSVTSIKTWTGENNSVSGVTDITIGNYPEPEEEINITNAPADYKSIMIRIYDRGFPIYENEYKTGETRSKIQSNEQIEYEIKGDQKMTLNIINKRSPEPDDTWDMILPSASAYYKGYNYAYSFTFWATGDESSRKELLEIFKEVIQTFKDLNPNTL